jgi:hypothetical protein
VLSPAECKQYPFDSANNYVVQRLEKNAITLK